MNIIEIGTAAVQLLNVIEYSKCTCSVKAYSISKDIYESFTRFKICKHSVIQHYDLNATRLAGQDGTNATVYALTTVQPSPYI